jgi:hypothetical protein
MLDEGIRFFVFFVFQGLSSFPVLGRKTVVREWCRGGRRVPRLGRAWCAGGLMLVTTWISLRNARKEGVAAAIAQRRTNRLW